MKRGNILILDEKDLIDEATPSKSNIDDIRGSFTEAITADIVVINWYDDRYGKTRTKIMKNRYGKIGRVK